MKINVGLIGFGTVGTGVVRVLQENGPIIRDKLGCEVFLKRIADLDLSRDRGVKVKKGVLTENADEIINDPEISIVIELIGGTTAAKDLIMRALESGKHVVTANKALLSTHGKEVFQSAAAKELTIGFEASVGGGIPIIKALREGLSANRVESIYGIINGTANYILTKMTSEGRRFEDVLARAQKKGYAEPDPTYDVEGIDTAHKLTILINLAYGTYSRLEDIYTEGISRITELDVEFAREFGFRIKLLAIAKASDGAIEARVHPGAGMMPTASAVVADIMDICRDLTRGVPARLSPLSYTQNAVKDIDIKNMDDLEIPYYLRFSALDKPGVLSKISGVLGAHNISISSVIQKGRKVGAAVPVVIAISEIEKFDVILDRVMFIRIEESLGAID
jgi:homoserine dehydrogenase